ncbi:hypothetical protein C0V97_08540 [Asaia sp. W19]|uniref:metal-dependent hydrolase n=1 Tax=unclassified Asaia TaxID=2685023 RepID=UPI000F8ED3EF|nr:metal-dependent hydrolase [Asaia sp. W19]RUT25885.1 hypothetical protein C0V97_08540 [Asaia sp. W19]
MIGRSHLVLGIACGLTAAAAGWLPLSWPVMIATGLGSLAPDLDTERSMLGCRMVWLSRPLSRMVGHRTVTHSLAVPLAAGWALEHSLGPAGLQSAWGGFLIGYLSHILADMMTGGCWALYPLSRNRLSLWPHAKTGSFREYVLLVACLFCLGWISYRCLLHHWPPGMLKFSHMPLIA